MKLTVGLALHSTVDSTSLIVTKAPEGEVEITVGGEPVTTEKPATAPAPSSSPEGAQIGKRYADDDLGIELLCTKAGAGTLAVNGTPIGLREAKPLPASD